MQTWNRLVALVRTLLARVFGWLRPGALDADFARELESHLAMAEDELVRLGYSPAEARRRARVELGGLTQLREAGRRARGLPWLDTYWLDAKLAVRMLRKSWGLTLVGGLAMAVVIAIGGGVFGFFHAVLGTHLPLAGGDRLVAITAWDPLENRAHDLGFDDLDHWRDHLRSLDAIAAFREVRHRVALETVLSETGAELELGQPLSPPALPTEAGAATPSSGPALLHSEPGQTLVGGPIPIAQISAEGLRLAGVPARLGRILLASDERPDAPPVAVIGHRLWQSRFGSDPRILGRGLRLGSTVHTVVGVMPEGFAFPVYHQVWTPLHRVEPGGSGTGRSGTGRSGTGRSGTGRSGTGGFGDGLFVFGRLAPGRSVERAHAEIEAVGLPTSPIGGPVDRSTVDPSAVDRSTVDRSRPPAAAGDSDRDLARAEPRIVPYTLGFVEADGGNGRFLARVILTLVFLLSIPPCANVAILVYARTVTRQEEIAARYVLGASRGRIVAQFFLEMLVLAVLASGVALALVRLGGRHLQATFEARGGAPFWIDFGQLSPATFLFTTGLAVFAATIAGALPARRATGRLLQQGLRSLGSRSSLRLGRTWTALIVAQITFAVAVLPTAFSMAWGTLRPAVLGPGFPAEQYLVARLAGEDEPVASNDRSQVGGGVDDRDVVVGSGARDAAARLATQRVELVHRLRGEAGILGVALSADPPGRGAWARVRALEPGPEVTEAGGSSVGRARGSSAFHADFNRVDEAFFEVLGAPLLAGRWLEAADRQAGASTVLVNRTLARHLAGEKGDADAVLGRRLVYLRRKGDPPPTARSAAAESEAYTIVGIVGDVPAHTGDRIVYHGLEPESASSVNLTLRVGSSTIAVAERLRVASAASAPALQLGEISALDEVYRRNLRDETLPIYALLAVTLSVLLLSAAGIYSLMAFTVGQRRREIGIRSALGAQPARLLAQVFRQALRQVGFGAACGLALATLVGYLVPIEEMGGLAIPGAVPAAAGLMAAIGLAAALGPARRGLRIEPTEALREG